MNLSSWWGNWAIIPISVYKNKNIALFGLGISGMSAASALQAGGADLVVFDDNEARCVAARDKGFTVSDLKDLDWGNIDALLLSPGVPLTHPEPHWSVKLANAANVPVIGDTELFFQEFLALNRRSELADKIIVLTGTNGKSTTTALTTHILNAAGETAVMGGNIGFGVLDMPEFGSRDEEGGTIYVLELSSYQIDLTPSLQPTAAGLLNITPDHIDRHGTVENYAAVKGKIFDNLILDRLGFHEHGQVGTGIGSGADGLGLSGTGVISVDDQYCRSIAERLSSLDNMMFVGRADSPMILQVKSNGIELRDDGFSLYQDGGQVLDVDLNGITHLRGAHNAQNAAFAFALAKQVTVNVAGLVRGLRTFPGLSHRMRQVGLLSRLGRRLLFVNDSKATNADASMQALRSYPEIYWIAGGRAKDGGIEGLKSHFSSIRKAFLIGEAAEDFGNTLRAANIAYEICGDIETAVSRAVATGLEAGSGEAAVLLSPAAASFDQFPNFEVRGEAFCDVVRAIANVEMAAEG